MASPRDMSGMRAELHAAVVRALRELPVEIVHVSSTTIKLRYVDEARDRMRHFTITVRENIE